MKLISTYFFFLYSLSLTAKLQTTSRQIIQLSSSLRWEFPLNKIFCAKKKTRTRNFRLKSSSAILCPCVGLSHSDSSNSTYKRMKPKPRMCKRYANEQMVRTKKEKLLFTYSEYFVTFFFSLFYVNMKKINNFSIS